jgi:hypothetical protein
VASESRNERLAAELRALRSIRQASDILDFQCSGSSPERYTLTFRGRGIQRCQGSTLNVDFAERHDVEVRLPPAYPKCPPDMRWMTPIFHPNVSFGGLLYLADIGLRWDPDLGLDLICERLWDVARFHYLDLSRAMNAAALAYFLRKPGIRLPTDLRPLRDRPPVEGIAFLEYRDVPQPPNREPRNTGDEVRFVSPLRHAPPRRRLYYIA